jgi:thioredoxin 1
MREITDLQEFKTLITGPKPVVVDFTATWCGPCKAIAPFFSELAETYPDIDFVKVDVDVAEEITKEYGITAMPTFHLYANGFLNYNVRGANKQVLAESVKLLASATILIK